MTGTLSAIQRTWLRGLSWNNCWTPMSATELGDPAVSELQSRGLVKIRTTTFGGREWRILDPGRDVLKAAESNPVTDWWKSDPFIMKSGSPETKE